MQQGDDTSSEEDVLLDMYFALLLPEDEKSSIEHTVSRLSSNAHTPQDA